MFCIVVKLPFFKTKSPTLQITINPSNRRALQFNVNWDKERVWNHANTNAHFYRHSPEWRMEQFCKFSVAAWVKFWAVAVVLLLCRSLVNQMDCFAVGLLRAGTSTNKSFSTAFQTVFQSWKGGSCVMIYSSYLVFLIGNLHDNLWLHDYVKIIL